MKNLKLILISLLSLYSLTFSNSFWLPQSSGVTSQLDKVHFANSNTGIVLEPWDYILRTTNGGVNWVRIYTGISGQYAVKFKDANTVYLFGYTTLYRSTNSGMNWAAVINTGASASGIFIFGETILLTGGSSIYKSTDNGDTWNSFSVSHSAYDVFFVNENTGWSVAAQYYPPPNPNMNIYNRIHKTSNGGQNWTLLSVVTSQGQPMYEMINFCDENTGYISGLYGTRKSTNGGLAWTIVKQEMSWGIYPVNKDTLWITALGLRMYVSYNGGSNWTYDSINTQINDVCILDRNTAWAVGNNGKIFISSTAFTPVGNFQETLPKEYILYQNYPNPFNPSTRIKYTVAENNSDVKIDVFDIKGAKVSTVVDKSLGAGNYENDFSANSLSSGIYFYTLKVNGTLKDTKKMVLMK